MQISVARTQSEALIRLLSKYCKRIEVAGSIRRRKPEVKDIELVIIPEMKDLKTGQQVLFGEGEKEDLLQKMIMKFVAIKKFEPRKQASNRRPPMGPRTYFLTYNPAGPLGPLPVDIFVVYPPADWGVIYTIRTGSQEFSHWIVTEALRKGKKVRDGQLWKGETKIPCPEEKDFFEALNIEYVEPWKRNEVPK